MSIPRKNDTLILHRLRIVFSCPWHRLSSISLHGSEMPPRSEFQQICREGRSSGSSRRRIERYANFIFNG